MLSCFLGGLKKEIQMLVKMFQPTTMRRVFALARIYEAANSSPSQQVLPIKSQKGLLGSKPLPPYPITMNPSSTGGLCLNYQEK